MKIAFVSQELYPDSGGAGIVAWQNARGLSKVGYDVTIYTKARHKDDYARIQQSLGADVAVKEMLCAPKVWPLIYYLSGQWGQYDRILLNDVPALVMAGLFMPEHLLRKSVVFLHSVPERTVGRNFAHADDAGFLSYEPCVLRVLKHAAHILSCSEFITEQYIQHFSMLKTKIRTHYAGVDIGTKSLVKRAHHDRQISKLLTVSRFERGKGFDAKYDVFKALIDRGHDHYRWVIVGDGAYRKEFEARVMADGLQDYVQIIGAVPRDQLSDYYADADIFWLLPEYEEAFGLVYLEAQMHGLPCLGYNRFGIKEAIQNEQTGFLVDESVACYALLAENKWRGIAAETCRQFAGMFDIDVQIETLDGILKA